MYQTASGSVKAEIKVELSEDIKMERKSPLVHPNSQRIREEEYDSSATVTANNIFKLIKLLLTF
jgi:hypothetical protein